MEAGAAWLLPLLLLLLAIAAAAIAILALRRRRWRVGAGAALLALAGTALAVHRVADLLVPPPAPPPHRMPAARGQVLAGPVSHVRDGDTIVVGQTPVRFADVDCPEKGTAEGDRATQALRRLLAGQQVRCRLDGRRSFDREIGTCALADGRNPGQALVAQGLCLRR
jgi:endonuclease YncB( thermonuclease family)